jgi:hypothetical protein
MIADEDMQKIIRQQVEELYQKKVLAEAELRIGPNHGKPPLIPKNNKVPYSSTSK